MAQSVLASSEGRAPRAMPAAEAAKLYVSPAFLRDVWCLLSQQRSDKPLTRAERILAARHYQEPACGHRSAAAALLAARKGLAQTF